MSGSQRLGRPLAYCLRASNRQSPSLRSFTKSCAHPDTAVDLGSSRHADSAPPPPSLAETSSSGNGPAGNHTNQKSSQSDLKGEAAPDATIPGPRRRRAALRSSQNIPFEQLPYQCFQEARKVLQADRDEKLKLIATERLRIQNLQATPDDKITGGARRKETRLASMQSHLEQLKIQADINDPLIKKRFEDGDGDMTKPIYRYLADRKWRAYDRLITVQRCTQHHIVPDLLPTFDPTMEVRMAFRKHNVQPGQHVLARISVDPPRLRVQVFDRGSRLLTIAAIDADVPDLDSDGFTTNCHYLACNIPIDPTTTSLPFSSISAQNCILPWTPPVAQKGAPNHRIAIIVLQQPSNEPIDIPGLLRKGGKWPAERRDFSMRALISRLKLQPVGLTLFRSKWDETTKSVMLEHGIKGADVEYKFRKIEAVKPKQKPRGWEATHTGPKYRSIGRGGDWQSYN